MTKDELIAIITILEKKQDAKEDIAYDHEAPMHERDYAGGYADGLMFALETIYEATRQEKSNG